MSNSKIHVVHELLRRGLIDKSDIMDGGITVADQTSRHRNALVMRKSGTGYFVKEAIPTQALSIQTLAREAATYSLVQQANGNRASQSLTSLAALMPRFILWDPQQRLLVLELLQGAENLGAHARRTNSFSPALAARFGAALATCHRNTAGVLAPATYGHIFPMSVPWALTIANQAESTPSNLSAANAQMLAVIRRYPNFPARLESLQKSWRKDTMIHGDLKFENCVLAYPNGQEGDPEIRVVDWEIGDIGDARWDVGSLLQSWLSYWIFSMPAGVSNPDQLAAQAQYPLETMQPAIRAFWTSYASVVGASGDEERELLYTCIGYGAARMIQTVFESMYQMAQLTPHAILMLQVSLNILEDPRAATKELLAL